MPFNPYDAPLLLKISPSFQKRLLILAPHLLVFILVIIIKEIHLVLKLILILGLLVSLIYYYRLHISLSLHKSVAQIKQGLDKSWFVSMKESQDFASVELLPSSFVSNYLIVLNFKGFTAARKSCTCTAILTRDSLSLDEYRFLRVRLKTSHFT